MICMKGLRYYQFLPKGLPVITRMAFEGLMDYKEGDIDISFDLGLSFTRIRVSGGVFTLKGYRYSIPTLLRIMREDYIYLLGSGEVRRIAFYRDNLFYKLYPVSPHTAPTIEISGIKMHRVVGVPPWEDAGSKLSILNIRRGEHVLDICTGLGYTAIHAFRKGGVVTTIEKDVNVLEMASYNPWSRDLENISIVVGDAMDVIKCFEDESFDVIIHDPPRLSRAGHLYSAMFYEELYRVLRRGGRLFHYTGKVGYRRRGIDIMGGVSGRLKKTGFKPRIMRSLMGVYAVKP